RSPVLLGDPHQFVVRQCRSVGRQERESLVNKVIRLAELADLAIPTANGVATVLDKTRPDPRLPAQALKLFEAHVADAEEASSAALGEDLHGAPRGPVFRRQTDALHRPMQ